MIWSHTLLYEILQDDIGIQDDMEPYMRVFEPYRTI